MTYLWALYNFSNLGIRSDMTPATSFPALHWFSLGNFLLNHSNCKNISSKGKWHNLLWKLCATWGQWFAWRLTDVSLRKSVVFHSTLWTHSSGLGTSAHSLGTVAPNNKCDGSFQKDPMKPFPEMVHRIMEGEKLELGLLAGLGEEEGMGAGWK